MCSVAPRGNTPTGSAVQPLTTDDPDGLERQTGGADSRCDASLAKSEDAPCSTAAPMHTPSGSPAPSIAALSDGTISGDNGPLQQLSHPSHSLLSIGSPEGLRFRGLSPGVASTAASSAVADLAIPSGRTSVAKIGSGALVGTLAGGGGASSVPARNTTRDVSEPPPPRSRSKLCSDDAKPTVQHGELLFPSSLMGRLRAAGPSSKRQRTHSPQPPSSATSGVHYSPLVQSVLDLGQRDVDTKTCGSCGMVYAPGDPSEERQHARFCARARSGFGGVTSNFSLENLSGSGGDVVAVLFSSGDGGHLDRVSGMHLAVTVAAAARGRVRPSSKFFFRQTTATTAAAATEEQLHIDTATTAAAATAVVVTAHLASSLAAEARSPACVDDSLRSSSVVELSLAVDSTSAVEQSVAVDSPCAGVYSDLGGDSITVGCGVVAGSNQLSAPAADAVISGHDDATPAGIGHHIVCNEQQRQLQQNEAVSLLASPSFSHSVLVEPECAAASNANGSSGVSASPAHNPFVPSIVRQTSAATAAAAVPHSLYETLQNITPSFSPSAQESTSRLATRPLLPSATSVVAFDITSISSSNSSTSSSGCGSVSCIDEEADAARMGTRTTGNISNRGAGAFTHSDVGSTCSDASNSAAAAAAAASQTSGGGSGGVWLIGRGQVALAMRASSGVAPAAFIVRIDGAPPLPRPAGDAPSDGGSNGSGAIGSAPPPPPPQHRPPAAAASSAHGHSAATQRCLREAGDQLIRALGIGSHPLARGPTSTSASSSLDPTSTLPLPSPASTASIAAVSTAHSSRTAAEVAVAGSTTSVASPLCDESSEAAAATSTSIGTTGSDGSASLVPNGLCESPASTGLTPPPTLITWVLIADGIVAGALVGQLDVLARPLIETVAGTAGGSCSNSIDSSSCNTTAAMSLSSSSAASCSPCSDDECCAAACSFECSSGSCYATANFCQSSASGTADDVRALMPPSSDSPVAMKMIEIQFPKATGVNHALSSPSTDQTSAESVSATVKSSTAHMSTQPSTTDGATSTSTTGASSSLWSVDLRMPPKPALLGIAQVWVHASYRGRGLGVALLDAARDSAVYAYTVPRDQIAFSQPTSAGRGLAHRYMAQAHQQQQQPTTSSASRGLAQRYLGDQGLAARQEQNNTLLGCSGSRGGVGAAPAPSNNLRVSPQIMVYTS